VIQCFSDVVVSFSGYVLKLVTVDILLKTVAFVSIMHPKQERTAFHMKVIVWIKRNSTVLPVLSFFQLWHPKRYWR